jgi:hypothetical protein
MYERMRGAKGYSSASPLAAIESDSSVPPKLDESSVANGEEVTTLLRGIRDNLASLVEKSARHSGSAS